MSRLSRPTQRWLHSSQPHLSTIQRQLPPQPGPTRSKQPPPPVHSDVKPKPERKSPRHVKRNELGVQMLSRELHVQIFPHKPFAAPSPAFVRIAQEHLEMHGLDPDQGSILPDTGFQLPPLQGKSINEHFFAIGTRVSQPWIDMANDLASAELPPRPAQEQWEIRSGWTRYTLRSDGEDGFDVEQVPFPQLKDGTPETTLVFDVETMPKYHPYAVMACAASPHAWYIWISPWLLAQSSSSPESSDTPSIADAKHLIPFGDPSTPRVVVGHNVSYDRARVLEEYTLEGTKTRYLDTMSLHVATHGISSHQRPAWMKYRKNKVQAQELERQAEAVGAIPNVLRDLGVDEDEVEGYGDGHGPEEGRKPARRKLNQDKRRELERVRDEIEASLPQINSSELDIDDAAAVADAEVDEGEGGEKASKRWEELTSANSLADVAKLHCGITVDKGIRNDFMTHTPTQILSDIRSYIGYCANDVGVTHAVYTRVLPAFRQRCPSPVSFAGVLTMGSSFLTVNESWEAYIANAERAYRELESGIKKRLMELAEEARELFGREEERWREDPWLAQLDWTPKVAGKSRGVGVFVSDEGESAEDLRPSQSQSDAKSSSLSTPLKTTTTTQPRWYRDLLHSGPLSSTSINRVLPCLLKMSLDGHSLIYSKDDKWHYLNDSGEVERLPTALKTKQRVLSVLSASHGTPSLKSGRMGTSDTELAKAISAGDRSKAVERRVLELARVKAEAGGGLRHDEDPWLRQLDWKSVEVDVDVVEGELAPAPAVVKRTTSTKKSSAKSSEPKVYWPKWYWDLAKPKKDMPPGTLDITVRNRVAPLLLRLSWLGYPLFHSREHGWTFRVPAAPSGANGGEKDAKVFETRLTPLEFFDPADEHLKTQTAPRFSPIDNVTSATDPKPSTSTANATTDKFKFYKLPHKDGEKANVGSPLAKTFGKYSRDGTLASPWEAAKDALNMNAQCSYWISARDRIINQMVVWDDKRTAMGFDSASSEPSLSETGAAEKKWGMILPQVVTMGTVTRRAIEKTWLTASNAKMDRVGSELKAMVRAPPGYSIVGADVDSEELWISSCMGDAQFGLHGATALGWMTLEGTKAAGTDLHSKTASILGISRDQAKVFNYSRIYGAGMRHAVLLLLQANAGMHQEEAQRLAENLYASTKGKNTQRGDMFGRKFWFGGTESFVFNKLEEIALSERPTTPALECGITHALSKEYLPDTFGGDYMTSRINWVVQSSGVDYLHLLIVAMDYLVQTYGIKARYLLSVHDELRYLVEDQDRYRAALALQIANLWTRSLFAYMLGMDDLPQGVAFFSSVDVDRVLRKEVDMPCVTPSQPNPIAPGESLNIIQTLEKTHGGTLWPADAPGQRPSFQNIAHEEGYVPPDCMKHRAETAAFLRAQTTSEFAEVKHLAEQTAGKTFEGGIGGPRTSSRFGKSKWASNSSSGGKRSSATKSGGGRASMTPRVADEHWDTMQETGVAVRV